MATWTQINTELNEMLGDPSSASYPDPLRLICFNRATEFLAATHTALFKKASLVVSGGIGTYPADLIKLGGVQTADKEWIEPRIIEPGEISPPNTYLEMHDGIHFDPAPIGDLTAYYYAAYPKMVDNNSVVTLPSWAEVAVLHLAIAFILTPGAIGTASLRRFQREEEAGAPQDNPMRVQAKFHMDLYYEVVTRMKPQDREMMFKAGR